MNERIKELMGETLDDKFASTWDTMTYEGLLKFSEKFAELIVKECSKVNNQFLGHRIGEIDLDLVYKEHFGVEE